MIRAGNSGRYFDDFEDSKCVGIGWNDLGDLRQYTTAAALREAYIHHFGNAKSGRTANAVAMIRKFRDDIQKATYSSPTAKNIVNIWLGKTKVSMSFAPNRNWWASLRAFGRSNGAGGSPETSSHSQRVIAWAPF